MPGSIFPARKALIRTCAGGVREGAGSMLDVSPIRAFADNYLWLIRGLTAGNRAVVVDPGDARPVLAALDAASLSLDAILVTHHHADHVGGVAELADRTGAEVIAPAGEPVPHATRRVHGGDTLRLERLGLQFRVIDVPGHTAGHVAYYGHGALFAGDTLFSGGCGRLFEGSPAQMLASLDALAALPPETLLYCAHEYTAANLRFALAVDPANATATDYAAKVAELRQGDEPTLPSSIGLERMINPFLRVREPAVQAAAAAHAGRVPHDAVATFTVVRSWKDTFR